MKIVYLVSTNIYSGAENITLLLVREMKRKHQVFYASPHGPIENYLIDAKIEHIAIDRLSVKEIRKIYKKILPDFFHAVDYRASTYCAMAGVPFIAHLHNNSPWLRKFCPNAFAMLLFSNRAKKVICVSDSIQNEYIFTNLVKEKLITIENVIDAESVKRKAENAAYAPQNYDLGFCGRLSPPKDPIRFVRIVAELQQYKPDLSAIMIGDGELREETEKEIIRYQLKEYINVIGFQQNPYSYLRACKLIIMPSRWEGFGLTAVEGMILGHPVLGTGVGGLRDVIGKDSGNICNSDKEFVDRSLELLNDPLKMQQVCDAVGERAKAYCDVENYIRRIEKIYMTI